MKKSLARAIAAGTFAVAVGAGIIAASAATLGGLSSTNLGADNVVVAACDTDGINISYSTSYNAATQKFLVPGATVSNVATACAGQVMKVELTGAAGVALSPATEVTLGSATSQNVVFASPTKADLVLGSSIVISG